MDVLWFRLSRRPEEPEVIGLRVRVGRLLVLINRFEYWQAGFVVPKGGADQVRARGLAEFRHTLVELVPELADRVDELQDWEQVKLLSVQSNRLARWHRPGLLCIGDAAHAMSAIAGVGINLAIQDAVEAANILTGPLQAGHVDAGHLEQIRRRRQWPTQVIQALQDVLQKRLAAPILSGGSVPTSLPWVLTVFRQVPVLQQLLAYLIAFGVRRVHVQAAGRD
jgi:2-polyprenyl-6-methoxyphenol hydroxylase-like FAD-dependent oxidoreductase